MAKQLTQDEVNEQVVDALVALAESDTNAAKAIHTLVDKVIGVVDLLEGLVERQEMTIELLTKHIDSDHE